MPTNPHQCLCSQMNRVSLEQPYPHLRVGDLAQPDVVPANRLVTSFADHHRRVSEAVSWFYKEIPQPEAGTAALSVELRRLIGPKLCAVRVDVGDAAEHRAA